MPYTRSSKFQCSSCGKRYDRADHLNRHLSSHENSRSFRCSICPKGYNRADLLRRHEVSHLRTSTADVPKRLERVTQACRACIAAKTKCEEEKPCKRCKLRGLNCEVSAVQPRQEILETDLVETSMSVNENSSSAMGLVDGDFGSCTTNDRVDSDQFPVPQAMESGTQSVDIPASLQSDEQLEHTDSWLMPAFFDQILQPRDPNQPGFDTPRGYSHPDISDFLQDTDFQFSDLDYSAIDLAMFGDLVQTDGSQINHQITNRSAENIRALLPSKRGPQDPIYRSNAFRRSPWVYWHPTKYHHTFTGQEEINVDDKSLSSVESPFSGMPDSVIFEDNLDQDSRDRVMEIVFHTSISRFSVPSFPSLDLLNNLIQAFFTQETQMIAKHIHSPTFNCRKARPELNLALVAAGAIAIPVRQIQKMGLVMHEVVRLAIAELFERDNSTTRDVQALQAYLTCLELGSWSGIKRKVEIACAFIQPLYVLLSQTGGMGQVYYTASNYQSSVESEEPEAKWTKWVERESLKRLVIHTFIHDSQVTMAFLQPPVLSYAHMTLPVPETAESWLAADAEAWKNSNGSNTDNSSTISLIDVFSDLAVLDEHDSHVDVRLCCLAAIHALANQVWEFRQQTALLNSRYGHKRRGLDALCRNRQRDLYEDLITTRIFCERRVSHHEISFLLQYIMMSLHVSLQDIQCFAGKNGEAEAKRAVPILREWFQDSTSRTALWHAGQVFRMARTFPPSTLRDFYAIGVYHAALTIWVYSLLRSNNERQSGVQTPAYISHLNNARKSNPTIPSSGSSTFCLVKLDQAETLDVRNFILTGQGIPSLYHPSPHAVSSYNMQQGDLPTSSFKSLSQPALVMEIATGILRYNMLFHNGDLPPLVQNLVSLMTDLGSLSVS